MSAQSERDQSDAYAYIRRTYGVEPRVGQRVRVDGSYGTLVAPLPGGEHYLRVLFDVSGRELLAHPTWRVTYDPEERAACRP